MDGKIKSITLSEGPGAEIPEAGETSHTTRMARIDR